MTGEAKRTPRAGRPLRLHFHHHRENHWAAVGLLIEEFAEGVANFVFDEGPVGGVTVEADEGFEDTLAGAFQEFFGVAHVDEAA